MLKRVTIITIMTVFTLLMCAMSAFAAGPVDLHRDAAISIKCIADNGKIKQMPLEIFKVADALESGEFQLTEDFEKYSSFLDLNALGNDNGDKIAGTLKGYVRRDKLTPADTVKTDDEGKAVFIGKPGIYLVIASKVEVKNGTFDIVPFLVGTPYCDDSNNWVYDIDAFPKCKFDKIKKPLKDISVVKVWKDSGAESNRPEKIVVQLVKDRKVEQEILLSDDNSWRYKWKNLDAKADYSVVEKPVEGYKTVIDTENDSFKITNSYIDNKTPEKEKKDKKLPQTGLLWWPVPVFIIAGLIMIFAGLYSKNKRKTDKK